MEIIQKFGLEAKLFLFQLINFLIIVFILKKFLFAPLKKILDERKRKIEQSLQDAENAKIALENASEKKKNILAKAKSSADTLMATVKVSIKETKEKAVIEAKQRSEQIIDEAKQKAATEFESMNKKIGKISVDISGKVMSKVLSDLFTETEKQKLMSRALEKIDENIKN
ncbi:F0F1 ATP synthase subunit B [Candidatus Endomicrobiellum trichonymphae]|uniref:ATP synthase subunit b n=1 Tax=Endomicrobium trichonymphae TaxID=1408204 RepID=ATPF_ENDTX|nr:F0F1 ATP synthase subunit B [Candidatus Endomicrobium trichonymphae]B1H0B9.1 RecName: Full=ATP synthase subunit b; AltName: Full=ATP synthase F(0) sector subunit b; AltName: Full=ATPase subunit I; AltName: Full=F-type ATPase subunit b; Short=F-ATPase subunit b [Candidatus Endomicrobium trichonymphae]BAG13951.1 FoF1-type ATPase subunit B [Candidatus Endomicrobium trichonymphae]